MLRCHCGETELAVRADATQAVGLVTCAKGHSSFLLDSRDHWFDVIQDGRPRQLRCRCKADRFRVAVRYTFRGRTKTVEAVAVDATCVACGAEREVFATEIDYEPTKLLVDRPLDPVDEPWLKAKRVELTGLWLPADFARVLRSAAGLPNAKLFVARHGERLREAPVDDVLAATKAPVFDVLMACEAIAIPAEPRDAWRTLPVVQIDSPMHIHYARGEGVLYYVRFALEDLVGGRAVARAPGFLAFAKQLRAWLASELSSERGKNAIDNPAEYARLLKN